MTTPIKFAGNHYTEMDPSIFARNPVVFNTVDKVQLGAPEPVILIQRPKGNDDLSR